MLRRTAPLLLLIAISQSLFSQNTGIRPSISISIGPSIPLGDFGRYDLNEGSSGFAGIGQALNVSYVLPFHKNFGLVLSVSGQRNPLNTKKLESEFNEGVFQAAVYGTGAIPIFVPQPTQYIKFEHWDFKKDSWLAGNIMAGVQMNSEPINNNVIFYSRVLIGVNYLSLPDIEGKTETDTTIATFTQTGSDGFGFIFGFSGGINYSISKKSYLLLNVGWIGTADIVLKDIKSTMTVAINPGSPGGSYSSSYRMGDGIQSIQSLNVTFGIGLKL